MKKHWRVRALSETIERRRETYVVTAFTSEPDGEGGRMTPFVHIEGENLPDPALTPKGAERLAHVLLKAAKYARSGR